MLFNSYEFLLLFFPLSILGYRAILKLSGSAAAQTWLIFASLFFYGYWNPSYLPLILISIAFNFSIAGAMDRTSGSTRQLLLAVGVTANVAALGYFKYASFAMDSFAWLSGMDPPRISIVLPLAISFFTFQQIAFLVDSYQRKVGDIGIREYALFVTFFPQLIAGPIVHHAELMPQFKKDRRLGIDTNMAVGLSIFALGLFKKVMLADTFALYATPVFDDAYAGNNVDFFAAWGGMFAFNFQVYFDFSGYSDMAIGAARTFGIRLPINFHSPFKAKSITEIWRRWHITLSRFLRDYVYIPLGGSKKGKVMRYVNLFVTMLVGGLWHGAGWTFVVWGALHGLFLTVNQLWSERFPNAFDSRFGKVAAWCLTFGCWVVASVPFGADTFPAVLNIWGGMLGLHGGLLDARLESYVGAILPFVVFDGNGSAAFPSVAGSFYVAIGFLIILLLPNPQEMFRKYRPGIFTYRENRLTRGWFVWRLTPFWALCAGTLFVISIMALGKYSEFLYFQF